MREEGYTHGGRLYEWGEGYTYGEKVIRMGRRLYEWGEGYTEVLGGGGHTYGEKVILMLGNGSGYTKV